MSVKDLTTDLGSVGGGSSGHISVDTMGRG
jgi:hypothetical protein